MHRRASLGWIVRLACGARENRRVGIEMSGIEYDLLTFREPVGHLQEITRGFPNLNLAPFNPIRAGHVANAAAILEGQGFRWDDKGPWPLRRADLHLCSHAR